jgi:hypothetical protein
LIERLESQGYTPIWLGEKQSTIPCPVEHIVDFSRMPEARNLELTLAIISQLKFTVQFWTASSRLSALMGTPYIIIESPDQLWGQGQEGFRLNLCGSGPRKIGVSHFLNFLENTDAGLDFVDKCIAELVDENYEVAFGLVNNENTMRDLMNANLERIGG